MNIIKIGDQLKKPPFLNQYFFSKIVPVSFYLAIKLKIIFKIVNIWHPPALFLFNSTIHIANEKNTEFKIDFLLK